MTRQHPFRATAVAAAVLTALAGGTVLAGRAGGPADPTAVTAPTQAPPTSPYAAKACPDPIRAEDVTDGFPDLAGAISMRLCVDAASLHAGRRHPPTAEELDATPPVEALVTGLEDVRDMLALSRPADPDRCASLSYLAVPGGLAITYRDGRTVLVQTDWCATLRVGGRTVPAGDLRENFLDALARQRRSFAYGRELTTPLSCDPFGESGPVLPAYEEIVDAALCSRYDEATGRRSATPLDATARATLDAAWRAARPHPRWPLTREDECVEGDDELPSLVVRTRHGDTVRLDGTGCGWLHLRGWRIGEGFEIPTTLDRLRG